jgi:hypothetical protein
MTTSIAEPCGLDIMNRKNLCLLIPALPKLSRAWLAILTLCISSHAQPFNIDWFTIGMGGGVSSGGPFTLATTLGAAEGEHSSGGNITLDGGFAPALEVPSPTTAPRLLIQQAGLNVVISWQDEEAVGFVLEESTSLPLSWGPSASGTPATIIPAGKAKFYRLRKP